MTPNLLHLHRLRISNVFLFLGPTGDRWLIDTGHRLERRTLLSELRRAGVSPRDLTGVLLTHRHSDHAGNAAYLQREHGLSIAAHRADAEILAGTAHRPRLHRRTGTALAGLFTVFENHLPASTLTVDRALDHGEQLGGMEVHWVGGHTPGSVFLRHADSGALFTGDLLLTAHPPLTLRAGLALPYPSFTDDMDRALASLRSFHQDGPTYRHLCPGHGRPWHGDARERVVQELHLRGVLPRV